MGSITVTMWGVRGSYPAPGAPTAQIGGNTPCIQVQAGNRLIILDAGTGIIGLGHRLVEQYQADRKPITATLLFSHTHHDHTQGFPFFTPTHLQPTTLYIFGPKTLQEDMQEVLARAMLPPVFPIMLDQLPCVRVVRNLNEGEVILLNNGHVEPQVFAEQRDAPPEAPDMVRIRVMRSYAHPQGVFVYRIEHNGKVVVYATDTEGYASGDQRLIRFVQNADLIIHDAQYTEAEYAHPLTPKQGWGHSTWQMAISVAQAAHVRQLVLFHHDPDHSDAMLAEIEKQAQAVFPQTLLAYEGLRIEI